MEEERMLSERERSDLLWKIETHGESQAGNAEIAAFANITPERFEEALKTDKEIRERLEFARRRGIGDLCGALWNKALKEKNLAAMQFLAFHYMGMSKETIKSSEKALYTGELSTEKLQQMLNELDG